MFVVFILVVILYQVHFISIVLGLGNDKAAIHIQQSSASN
jgi:hypothetical protein